MKRELDDSLLDLPKPKRQALFAGIKTEHSGESPEYTDPAVRLLNQAIGKPTISFVCPDTISLSALSWKGSPVECCFDPGDPSAEFIGKYVQNSEPSIFKNSGFNEELQAYEFTPVNDNGHIFHYEKVAHTGRVGVADEPVFWNLWAEAMSPLVRIRIPGQNHWPEQFDEVEVDPDRVCSIFLTLSGGYLNCCFLSVSEVSSLESGRARVRCSTLSRSSILFL